MNRSLGPILVLSVLPWPGLSCHGLLRTACPRVPAVSRCVRWVGLRTAPSRGRMVPCQDDGFELRKLSVATAPC
jgi:hypothetical protein